VNISTIRMVNFMSHRATSIELPPSGVVVITGPNGAGKSSFVEAVAFGIWGKTLRGTTPWRAGEAGTVEVHTTDFGVLREISAKGTTKLRWGAVGTSWDEYDTQKKAADALEQFVGEQELWRRTHVFSSQDAAHFTLATDGERKRLLEQLLGLDRFDAAYAKVSEDRKRLKSKVDTATIELERAKVSYETAKTTLRAFDEEALEPEPQAPKEVNAEDLRLLQNRMRAIDVELNDLHMRMRDADVPEELIRTVSKLQGQKAALDRQFKLIASGKCPTCEQNIASTHHDRLEAQAAEVDFQLAQAEKRLSEARQEVALLREQIAQQITALQAERRQHEQNERVLARAQVEFEAFKKAHAAWAMRQAARAQKRATLVKAIGVAEDVLGNAEDTLAQLQFELAELTAVQTVFGLKGVRAHVLSKSLAGIEQIANVWLQRIAQAPLQLELKPYKDLKSGGTQDAISLEVHGAGGGHGYKASSGGERRRIDAALLLALAEVASAAYGRKPGTVFVDEVFDALDADGIEAVAEALAELALERCVVVITHDELLARKIPAVKRVRVEAGKVA